MIDPASVAVLQELLRREGRSLLHYVSESFPWTRPEEKAAVARLQEMVKEEADGAARIARFLSQNHVVPAGPLGPYPMAFTNINYISLDHLMPMLKEHQHTRIAELEADLKKVANPECRQQLQAYIDLKRRHT